MIWARGEDGHWHSEDDWTIRRQVTKRANRINTDKPQTFAVFDIYHGKYFQGGGNTLPEAQRIADILDNTD